MNSYGGNHNVHEGEEGPSKKKKPRIEAHETSDVSSPTSSLVVENDNGFTIESAGVVARQLIEMGCSCEQVAHAMRECGNATSIDKMLDFILTTFYHSWNEGCTSSVPTHEKYKWRRLKDMGFSDEHIDAAIKACGKESDTIDLVEFIQAHFCINDPFSSMKNKVCLTRLDGCTSSALVDEKDKWRHLEDMGFSEEHIDAAIKACGKESDTIDMVEFIQAHFCINDPCLSMKNEVCLLLPEGCMSRDLTLEKDLGRHLEAMGFTEEHIETAMKACGKEISIEGAIEYIQALHCVQDESSSAMEKEVDSSEDEDKSGLPTFQKLINIGFSSSAVENAMETCESLDFEDLLNFLLEADSLPGEDLQVEDGGETFAYAERYREKG